MKKGLFQLLLSGIFLLPLVSAQMNLGGIGGTLIGWLLNPLIWVVILFGVVGVTFGILALRKRRKLIYDCLEIVNYREGKAGFNLIKAGYFGKQKHLKGLWDTGEEQLETKDGDIIYEFSTEDFQEINGKRGIVCYRDPVNQNILVPVSDVNVSNRELLAEIAPAEYRDVALDIIKDADRETSDFKEKLIQFAMWGLVVIFSLVSIIVIVQMVKNGQDSANELILEAGKTCLEGAKQVCSEIANAVGGNAP